jgi:putative phosphoribosyl transferase
MLFRDRQEAGMALASLLRQYAGRDDVVVLGLARGGVPVASEVARLLRVPFDVLTVRKLGVPGHEELAMGAIASGGVLVINEEVVRQLGITARALEQAALEEQEELDRRELVYRQGRPPLDVHGRAVIVIDDGLATGSSMRAAVAALRQRDPARIVVATPIGSHQACDELAGEVEEVVCAATPDPFYGVGSWYRDFRQTTDAEVQALLGRGDEYGAGEAARPP